MSSASLNAFLLKLQNDLENSKTGPYRQLIANRRPHLFEFNSKKVAGEVYKELAANNIPVSSADRKVIFNLVKDFKTALEQELKLVVKLSNGKLKSTPFTLKYVFTSNTVTNNVGEYSTPGDVFDKVKDTYRPHLQTFFDELQKYLKSQTFVNPETGRQKTKALRTKSGKVRKSAGRAIHAGHVDDAGIAESMMADVLNDLIDIVGVLDDKGSDISHRDIITDLEALGIDLSIVRDDSTDTHTIRLESAKDNMERGREIKKLKAQLIAQVKAAVAKTSRAMKAGEGLEHLSGSDSIAGKKRKKLIDKTLKPFERIKGAIVEKEDTTIKKSSQSPKKKKSIVKAAKGRKSKTKVPVTVKRARVKRKGIASKPLALVSELNRQLPATVVKNMGSPRLTNRSGRFAASVQVTDVTETAQGFPSIGYTYQKRPYQTFEKGFKSGSEDLDPRSLIDYSIREIAVKFALGRFYTRRV